MKTSELLRELVPVEPTDDEIRRAVNLPFVEDESGTEWVMLTPKMLARAVRRVLAATPAAPSQPAVPQGWKSVLIPTEWTIGPNLFKDWCSQWFGPDSDDEYLMHAAHALLGLAAAPAAPSQEPDVPQGFKPVGYLRSDEFDGHVFEPIDGTWPFDELLFSLSTSPEPVQEVTLTDEEIKRNWSGGACPPWGIKFARAIIAALREKEGK